MWRVYYDDGTCSENEITQPFRVICIVQPREKTGREVLRGQPYYLLKNGIWYSAEDQTSLIQQMVYFARDIEAVVMGIWAAEDKYREILIEATNAPGVPRRSADDLDTRR